MSMTTPAVLAIAAHPDDIEFNMAGSLLRLKERGWALHYMNLCDGCCGTETEDREAIRARRATEALAAAALIGARHYPALAADLELYHTTDNLARVIAVVREAQPSIVLAPSPNDYMEDHMNASRLAVTAAFCRGMRNIPCQPPRPPVNTDVIVYHAMPAGLHDGMRRRVRAGLYVDIGPVLPVKRRMLACHASQKEWLDASQGMDSYLDAMERMAREVGRLSGRFDSAEGWRRHSHLGFAVRDFDPLAEALGSACVVDERYERDLEEGGNAR